MYVGSGLYKLNPNEVNELEISPEEVDSVYLTIEKMQRYYHNNPTSATARYYSESFSKVEDAYLSRNMNAFQSAVRNLMFEIYVE